MFYFHLLIKTCCHIFQTLFTGYKYTQIPKKDYIFYQIFMKSKAFPSDFPPQEIPATVVPLSQVPSEVFVAVTWRTLGPFEFLRPKIN